MAKAASARRPARKEPPKKPWSFLAYIAGDNNLSDAGLKDLVELGASGSSGKIHVAAQIDTRGEHTGSIRYEITEKDRYAPPTRQHGHRIVIDRLRELDMGDPDTLLDFLKWGLKRYPADRVVLSLWGHGTGFRIARRAIAYDDFGSSLDIPELHGVLRRSGFGRGRPPLAILGFDACLMSMLEIAHSFRSQAEILIASQQTEPGDGWPYQEVLDEIKTANTPASAARRIVKAYIEHYRNVGIMNVTQSAIRVDKTDAAFRALHRLGLVLTSKLPEVHASVRKVRMQVQCFAMADYVDALHMSNLLMAHVKDAQVVISARKLAQAIHDCVLDSLTLGEGVRDAYGLSIWFPAFPHVYFSHRAKYNGLRCNQRYGGWLSFLDACNQ